MRGVLVCVVGILVMGGCRPDASPVSPSPGSAASPGATVAGASPEPATPTLEAPPWPCLADDVAPTPTRAALLRVVYWDNNKLWLWKEEANTAAPLPLPDDAVDARLSADGQLIAFRRILTDRESELWVIDSDGGQSRRLATASAQETLERYPNAVGADLHFDWIEKTHTLAFSFYPSFDALGEVPIDTVRLVDADTGALRVVIPAGEVNALIYAPDGGQAAALTTEELRLIDTRDGRVQHILRLPVVGSGDQSLAYSPDGRYLVVFTTGGVAIVDPLAGTYREAPLEYKRIGLGHYSATPSIDWIDSASFYTLIANDENVFDPGATFALWRIDALEAAAAPVNTFTGVILSARFSPDFARLAFWTQRGNVRDLYLADVAGGNQIVYVTGNLIEFLQWNPDNVRFLYWFATEQQPRLGHICAEPVPLPDTLGAGQIQWVDSERLIALNGQPGKWELRLHFLRGDQTLIAATAGEYLSYFFFVEPGF